MPSHYGVLVVRGKEVNIYTTFEGFPEEPGRLPEAEIMRIAGMKKKPFAWWKSQDKKRAKNFPFKPENAEKTG